MNRCGWHTWVVGATALFLAGCLGGAGRGPEWVRLRRSSPHPDDEWLIGVGRGKNPTIADNVARSDLSKPIEVRIKSEVTTVMGESTQTVNGKTTSSSHQSVTDRLVARTNIKLQGVEIVERWHDAVEDVYCSLAVLNRKEATAGLNEEASQLAAAANELIAHARAKAAAGDKPAALSAYRRAMVKAVRHGMLAARLRVVGKRAYRGETPEMSPIQLELVFRKIAEGMRIAVVAFEEYPGHNEKPCGPAEAGIVNILQAEGLTAAAVGDEIRSLGHAGLTADLSRTREALSGRAAYIVIGKVKVVFQGEIKSYARPAYGYQAAGEGIFIDLGTGKIIANVSFPAGPETKKIALDHGAAASGALEKGAAVLVGKLSGAVRKKLLGR